MKIKYFSLVGLILLVIDYAAIFIILSYGENKLKGFGFEYSFEISLITLDE